MKKKKNHFVDLNHLDDGGVRYSSIQPACPDGHYFFFYPYFEIIIESQEVVQIVERSPELPPPWLVTSYIIIVLY